MPAARARRSAGASAATLGAGKRSLAGRTDLSSATDHFRVAACIPTKGRPGAVRRVLGSLADQRRPADIVLVVDASTDGLTRAVCEELSPRFGPGTLVHEDSPSGLTVQRRRAIAKIRRDPDIRYLAFLDDDMVLGPDFLATIIAFMETDEGRAFGGVCGYDLVDWGRPFGFTERLFHRIGIFDGELQAGRWLYCGHFLELDRLSRTDGVRRVDFLPGGLTVWRTEIFDHFLPPLGMPGYALNEDKHFSLRVATKFGLAVHCDATASHLRAPSGRPRWVRFAYDGVRAFALMIRECDPAPTRRRYLAFLCFQVLWIFPYVAGSFARRRSRDFKFALGLFLGWLSCVVNPPARTADGLGGDRSAQRPRVLDG